MQKILLLGGSGYLGQRLIQSLADRWQIYAITRSADAASRIRTVSPTVRILSAEDAAAIRFHRIFNLVVDYGRGGASLVSLMESNLLYPLRLLADIEADAVINVSTALPRYYSNYSLSKKLLEDSLQFLERTRGRPFFNVHLHNMYGPGAHEAEFVQFVARQMLDGRPVEVSACENSRDFIFIEDVVRALSLIALHTDRLTEGSPIEIGTGRATCLRDLLFMIQRLARSASEIRLGVKSGNPLEPHALSADTTAMCRLGWTPRFSLEEGLQATIESLASGQCELADQL
jgi:CDP-paratose synthetase